MGSDRGDPNEDWWEWKVSVAGPRHQLASITSVTYHLHSSFPDSPVRVTTRRGGFSLEREGWDNFRIKAVVEFRDGHKASLYHDLFLN
jgi:transcription initiation factor IIF auxiliary subunit